MLVEEINTIRVLIGWGAHRPALAFRVSSCRQNDSALPSPFLPPQNVWWKLRAGEWQMERAGGTPATTVSLAPAV